MPLVHFDRQTVHDFFNISVEDAESAIKEIGYKDPIDVHDEFSGDDVKAIAMTYAHRKYPNATNDDKVSFRKPGLLPGLRDVHGRCSLLQGTESRARV